VLAQTVSPVFLSKATTRPWRRPLFRQTGFPGDIVSLEAVALGPGGFGQTGGGALQAVEAEERSEDGWGKGAQCRHSATQLTGLGKGKSGDCRLTPDRN